MLEVQTGDLAAGIATLGEARARYRTSGDIAGEVNTLGQLAVAYAGRGEPRRSFAVLDTALVVARRHGFRSEESSALELLGDLYREAGEHRHALDLYERARQMNHEMGLPIEEGSDLSRQAEIYAALGDLDRARLLAGEALELHRAAGATVEKLTDLLLLAELDHLSDKSADLRGHLAEAREVTEAMDSRAARIALALSESRIADHARDGSRVLEVLSGAQEDLSTGGYESLWEAEAMRARAHAWVGDLQEATRAGYRAVSAVERARKALGSGYLRTALLADRQTPYVDLIDVLLRQERVDEAFEVADASRGRAFLEHLSAVPASPGPGNLVAQRLAEGERLLREIDELVLRRDAIEALPPEERGPPSDDTIEALTRRLEQTRSRYEEVLVRSAERDVDATAILGGRRVRSGEVRRALRPDEVVLEYVAAPDRVILFVATRDRIEWFASPVPLPELVRRLRVARELSGRRAGPPSPTAALESLYGLLIQPAAGSHALTRARRLIIVPDPAFNHLPFAALRDPRGSGYLVERYALSYLPTAAALPLLRADGKSRSLSARRSIPATVFAPLPDELPATPREARAVSDAWKGSRVLSGGRATEEALRQALSSERVVHVASHAVLESANPLFSRIVLARGDDTRSNDGRLEMHEILGIGIRSPLVFLSGCETETGAAGSSTFAVGDDYATLARAFLFAGAQSVIATLWRIDDDGAALFASRFYDHLGESSVDEALARAQREMIGSARHAAPYYWASYRYIGGGALPSR
jgi:CHAT domain-containing protein